MAQPTISPMFAPDLVAQQTKLTRSQAMADLLRQQSMAPSEGTEIVGGWAIPKGGLGGLNKLAQALGANYMNSKNDKAQAELSQALATRQNEAYDQLFGLGGQSAQPSPQAADANGTPATPATPAAQQSVAPQLTQQQKQGQMIKNLMKFNPEAANKLLTNALELTPDQKNMAAMGQDPRQMGLYGTTEARNKATLITSPNQVVTTPEGVMSITPDAASGMQTTVGADGQLVTSPIQGAAEAQAARAGLIAGAQEGAKAGFDLVDVETPQGTVKMTKAQAAAMAGGGAQPTSAPQEMSFDSSKVVSDKIKMPSGQFLNFTNQKLGDVVNAVLTDKNMPLQDRNAVMDALKQKYSLPASQQTPAQGIKLKTEEQKERAKQTLEAQTVQLKKVTESANAAQATLPIAAQMRKLIADGVYENDPQGRLLAGAATFGLNRSQTAANTESLKKLGDKLLTAGGSLGAGISNADVDVMRSGQGDFSKLGSNKERLQYLDIQEQLARQVSGLAQAAMQEYQKTGSLPSYAMPVSAVIPVATAQPSGKPKPPASAKNDFYVKYGLK